MKAAKLLKSFFKTSILLLLLLAVVPVFGVENADPLYLYYFEYDDAFLHEGEIQRYAFATLPGEEVTIAVHGLDGLVVPDLRLLNENGDVLQGSISPEGQPYIRLIQFTARRAQLYLVDVEARSANDEGGLARIMIFDGDPIAEDLTYLDTLNPLLPGRAFMVGGDPEREFDGISGLRTGVEVLPVERLRQRPEIFAARGSDVELPPIADRFDPATSDVWFNEDGERLYFFTVSSIPERLTVATEDVEYDTYNLLTFFFFDYFFIVGEGSDPILFAERNQPCASYSLDTRAECVRSTPLDGRGEPAPSASGGEAGEATAAGERILNLSFIQRNNVQGCVITGYQTINIFGRIYTFPIYGGITVSATTSGEIIDGSYCGDTLTGATGLTATDPGNALYGYDGDDTIIGSGGIDTIVGGFGNDLLIGGTGADRLFGEDGNDIFNGGDGIDTIVGGLGNDVVDYSFTYSELNGYTANTTALNIILPEAGATSTVTTLGGTPVDVDDILEIEGAIGSSGNDTITGSTLDNMIYGSLGVDTINGGAGNDTIYGFGPDAGLDFDRDGTPDIAATNATAANDNDIIYGGSGNDTLYGNGGNDTIYGGLDNDIIYGGLGDDIRLDGGLGNDTIYGENGNDTIYGGDGADIIYDGLGNDTVYGDAGNDIIYLDAGTNTVEAGAGSDYIAIISGQSTGTTIDLATNDDGLVDTVYFGTGNIGASGGETVNVTLGNEDVLNLSGQTAFTLDLGTTSTIGNAQLNLDWAYQTTNQDYIDCQSDITNNRADCDAFYSGATDPVPGVTVHGSSGADTVTGTEFTKDTIYTYGGDDTVYATMGPDALYGGAGTDLIDYSLIFDNTTVFDTTTTENYDPLGMTITLDGTSTVNVVGSTLTTEMDSTINGFENVRGSPLVDTINGSSVANTIYISNGNDTIYGNGGSDTVDFTGYSGISVNLSGATSTTGVNGNTYTIPTATITGSVYSTENIIATAGDDNLRGNASNNIIQAGAGNDTIDGTAGTDYINGDTGRDTLTYAGYTSAVTFDVTSCGSTCGANGTVASTTFNSMETLTGSNYNDTFNVSGTYSSTGTNYGNGTTYVATSNYYYLPLATTVTNSTADDLRLSGGSGTDTINFASGTQGFFILDPADRWRVTYAGSGTSGNGYAYDWLGGNSYQLYSEVYTPPQPIYDFTGTIIIGYTSPIYSYSPTDVYITFLAGDCIQAGDSVTLTGTANADTWDSTQLQSFCNETINAGLGTDTADYSGVTLVGSEYYQYEVSTGSALTTVSTVNGTTIGTDTLNDMEVIIGSDTYQDVVKFGATSASPAPASPISLTFNNGTTATGSGGDTLDFSAVTSGAGGIDLDLALTTEQFIFSGDTDFGLTLPSNFANITGSGGADTFDGNTLDNIITGGAGGDTINGDAGNDTLVGEGGTDTVNGEAGNDTIIGTADGVADTFIGGADTDTVTYSDATYTVTAALDVVIGDANGANVLVDDGSGNVDTITETEILILSNQADTITTTSADTTNLTQVQAGGGNDSIGDGDGSLVYYGQDGDDTFYAYDGDNGTDTYNGGIGTDTVSYGNLAGSVTYTASTNVVTGVGGSGSDTLVSIENLELTNQSDTVAIDSTTPYSTLSGSAGDDTFTVSIADFSGTILDGGTHTSGDSITLNTSTNYSVALSDPTGTGTAGTVTNKDTAATLGSFLNFENVTTGSGDDTFEVGLHTGGLSLNGSGGTDTVDYSSAGALATITLNAGTSATIAVGGVTDSIQGIENIVGTGLDDVVNVTGASTISTVYTGAGSDTFNVNNASATTTLDGQGDADTYNLNTNTNIDVLDTGGTVGDCVTYVSTLATALTITQSTEDNYTVYDATPTTNDTNPASMQGIECFTTGLANDTFNLDFDTAGVANTYNAAGGTDTASYSNDNDALLITLNGTTITVQDTGSTGPADTLQNFESVTAGNANDNFVVQSYTSNVTLNGDGGTNTATYNVADDLEVTLNGSGLYVDNTLDDAVTAGANTLTNITSVTTGSGSDSFNLDLNGIIDGSTYFFDGGSSTDTYSFTFNGTSLSSDTYVTVYGDGTDVLDFTSVSNEDVNIDLGLLDTAQNVFDQFWLTLSGTFADVEGSAGNDTIEGNTADNTINGYGGNDTLIGDGGADTIDGGNGADTVIGGEDVSCNTDGCTATATGDTSTDTLTGGADTSADTIIGGNRVTCETAGTCTASGGTDGADTITSGGGADTVVGGNYIDCTTTSGCTADGGTDGADTIDGGTGNDTIVGGNLIECNAGGTGTDAATPGTDGGDTIYGGNGGDTINGDNVVTNCDATTGTNTGGADTIYGGNNNADGTVEGAETTGSDTINGGDGGDTIYGGNNNTGLDVTAAGQYNATDTDTINGEGGNDTIYGGNNNTDMTQSTAPSTDVTAATDGADNITGGDGNDTIYGGNNNTNLNDGGDKGDAIGTDGADTISGTGADDNGNDTIYGGNNNTGISLAGGGPASGADAGDTISDTQNTVADTDTIYGGNQTNAGQASDGTDTISVNDADGTTPDDTVYTGNSDGSNNTPPGTTNTDTEDTVNP